MSTENENIVAVEDDLDLFANDFFGQKSEAPETTNSEEEESPPDAEDAPEDTHEEETPDVPEEDLEEDEAPAPEPKKKNRLQDRIDEVVGKQREAERQLQAALDKINELQKNNEPKPKPQAQPVVNDGPTADELNEDGTDKYPLGEFDPQYIRDLTRHTLKVEREALKAEEARETEAQKANAERAELQNSWNQKLDPARERYPDFSEKTQTFLGLFESIDEQYGDYIATVLKSVDHGPDVLYYLANNPDEAVRIINSGAQKATLSIGAINAKFEAADQEKQSAKPKVSKAPTPPPHVNKGAAVSVAEVPDDTDDLDAFSRKLFPKSK